MKTSCCQSRKILKEKDYIVCMNTGCENYMRPSIPAAPGKWNKIFLFFFFIFIFILSFNDFSYNNTGTTGLLDFNKPLFIKSQTLSKENLRRELDSNLIICPEQVYAQILIESGHLNSFLTRKTNNLLGMRYPYKRKTTAIGLYLPSSNQIVKGSQAELKKYRSQNNYAVYSCWEDCVKDYKFWQDKNFKLTERYLTFLGNYYAEDSLYVSKIRNIAKKR